MHIPDGFLSGPVIAVGGVTSAVAVGISAWRASREVRLRPLAIPLLATTAAFVFAAQMLNFPIGGGTSGHFLGAATVAALLGPWSACLVISLVLVIQCLGFADGGLTALGANVANMGVIAGFGSYFLMRALRSALPVGRAGYLAAAAVASWASIVAASAACALELSLSGTSPFWVVLPAMVGVHAVIGIGEALIAVAVLSAVIASRPDILPGWSGAGKGAAPSPERRKVWILAGSVLAAGIVLAAFVSPFASSSPDGLEKVAEEKEFAAVAEGRDLWKAAPLPDYTVPGAGSGGHSTGLAGILGTAAVFAAGFGLVKLLGRSAAGERS